MSADQRYPAAGMASATPSCSIIASRPRVTASPSDVANRSASMVSRADEQARETIDADLFATSLGEAVTLGRLAMIEHDGVAEAMPAAG